jgi:ectoine hydrolase
MIFSKNEYQDRLKKVQASMQKKGIELLISQDPSNMNYLTGYDAWSFLLRSMCHRACLCR